MLEISYTRVISFKLFYYYTYLVIGLALLGIGCGGVIVAISRGGCDELRRRQSSSGGLLLGAVWVGVGYVVVATIRTDTIAIWDYGSGSSLTNLARLLVICLALFASFVAVGVMIAALFAREERTLEAASAMLGVVTRAAFLAGSKRRANGSPHVAASRPVRFGRGEGNGHRDLVRAFGA